MTGVFEIVLKKLIDLVGDLLKGHLPKPTDKSLKSLGQLHYQLKIFASDIERLIASLEFILADIEHNEVTYGEFNFILYDIRHHLDNLKQTLCDLGTGLEIYASETSAGIDKLIRVEDFYLNEEIPEDIINWVAPMNTRGQKTKEWRDRLSHVLDLATEARSTIAKFISATYSFSEFQKIKPPKKA
jgi:hypothetical protein